MKKIFCLIFIFALFNINESFAAGSRIRNAPQGERTEANVVATDAFPLQSALNGSYFMTIENLWDYYVAQSEYINPAFNSVNCYGETGIALGTSGTYAGKTVYKSGTGGNNYYFTIQGSNFGANLTWSLPIAAPGGANYLLNVDADGTMGYTDPSTLGSASTSLDDVTWGSAAGGSQTWTWDTGASTDPSLTINDTAFTFNKKIAATSIETTRSATVGGSVIIGYEGSNNGDSYVSMKAPDARDTTLTLLYPTEDPSAGQVLTWSAPDTSVSTGTWATPVIEGTATGGVLLGDASPDTAGEFGFASNQLSVHDGTASRDVLQVASTTITKTEYIPIAYAEDGATAPSASAVTASTRKVRTREFSGTADNDVEIHWMVPLDYYGGVKFRFIGYVTNATAPANTEVLAFSLAGCSNGNSDALGCTAGTAQTSSITADATYAQYDRITGAYSDAITVTNIAAGESVHLKLTRLATSTDTYAQAFGLAGIEIKYQAKINASGDY